MSHPFDAHREHKVQQARVAHIAKGYATGGAVKRAEGDGFSMKTARPRKEVMDVEGRACGGRLDRPARAKGGRVGKTNVTVVVAPQSAADKTALPVPVPAGAGAAPPTPPMPPPRPPVMPPPGGAPGMPPGMMRNTGGRAYAKGGAVKSGATWEEGRRNGTQVTHSPGKNDTDKIDYSRAKLTRRTGGKVEMGSGMGPKMNAGADSGEGRLEKAAMQKRRK